MLLTQSNTEVLTIVSQNPAGISTADIFKRLVDVYKDSTITTPGDVSKAVWTLRSKDYITTSKDLKKKLHKITGYGKTALKHDDQERLELAITADIAGNQKKLTEEVVLSEIKPVRKMGFVPVKEPDLPAIIPEPFTHKFTPEQLQDLVSTRIEEWRFNNMKADDSDLAVTLKKRGYTVLDPLNDLHFSLITIINAMEAASSHPGITRKEQKIDTLQRLSVLLSDDISTVLGEIVTDLTGLNEKEAVAG